MDKTILEVVRDSAKDLHEAGVMKQTTLREFDALCLPPVKELTAEQSKRIRCKSKAGVLDRTAQQSDSEDSAREVADC